ncbi:IclR family transcriptional regulator [Actinoalloteichus caeruleus]|uniref:Transcriptional regulator, IclR family n=1 Tax=Actinoalloteichus caeruleus DSM 43889 TaxID=1120930 RepID=A0ABT1JG10_ACTCY|nr:IclR family transcriptional regulator [Actinoalloteichus caeruleus]MCP2330716.1 transcriptional regulator, IclR family [Actinoalloteichus caeruleus DSM 43889]
MSQSLARALSILIDLGEREQSLDDLAERLGVHKTTVLRLLRTLESERFVFRDDAHRYHLGSRLFALSSLALEQREVRNIASPHLAELNQRTGQTVHLAVYEAGEVIYVDKYDSRHPVRMYSRIGLRAPLNCAAVSKVLLADMPPAKRRGVVDGIDFVRFTDQTITDAPTLLAELDRVADQGYAVDQAEHESFINCVGAPVRDASGRVAAAVSVSVPTVVLSYEQVLELLPDLLSTAAAISRDCGYGGTAPPRSTSAR